MRPFTLIHDAVNDTDIEVLLEDPTLDALTTVFRLSGDDVQGFGLSEEIVVGIANDDPEPYLEIDLEQYVRATNKKQDFADGPFIILNDPAEIEALAARLLAAAAFLRAARS